MINWKNKKEDLFTWELKKYKFIKYNFLNERENMDVSGFQDVGI